jgi:predicted DNA-binding transcriptional regulator YafY
MPAPCLVDNRRAGDTSNGEDRYASLRLPLVRLLQLVRILQSGRFPNSRRLAEACAVSRRTIYRDLAILEAAGIPVIYRPDRQGYQLAVEGFLQPAQLDDQETLALLLLSRLCPGDQPFGLLTHVRSGVDKVIQALPGELRGRVTLASELIAGDPLTLDLPEDRQPIYEAIWWALRQRRQMRLWYREDSPGNLLTTKVSLYRLARIHGYWSLVGRSTLHREIRLFRIPWIHRVDVTDEPYSIPPRFQLERWLSRLGGGGRSEALCEVQLRFTSQIAPVVQDTRARIGQILLPLASGELDVFLEVPALDEIVLWVLGFGDQVEVRKPAELRRAVRDRAERIARIHSDPAG